MNHRHLGIIVSFGFALCVDLNAGGRQNGTTTDSSPPILREARQAVGGEKALSRLRSVQLIGTVTNGFNGVTGESLNAPHPIELWISFPDNYVRLEHDTVFGVVKREGFSGDVLIRRWQPIGPGVQVSPTAATGQIDRERTNFARLALGLFAITDTALILKPIEMHGKSTVTIQGPSGFRAFLDVDDVSRVPLRVRYEDRVSFPRRLTAEEIKAGVPSPSVEQVEVTLAFEDRQPIAGLSVPRRIRRLAKNVVFENITIDSVNVNPPLDRDSFIDRPVIGQQ